MHVQATSWVAILIVALVAGCTGPVGVPEDDGTEAPRSPPAPQGTGLPIGFSAGRVSSGSEPSVLTDRNGEYVWIGDTSGGYFSSNNGTTWTAMAPLALGFHFLSDGWALAQDELGNLYAADLSDNHVDVGRSSDAGRSWNQIGYYAGVSGAADRPWIAAAKGDVVLFYFDAPAVAVGVFEHCARSTDGGLTFTDRDPVTGPPQAGSAFYDSAGRFYYSQSSGVLYRYAGTCLSNPTAIQMIPDAGVNNMIQSDVEGTDLYMAAATDGAHEITLAGSHDGDPAKRLIVSPPELKANTYATVSVHNGQVAVAWYGSTTDSDPSQPGFAGTFDVHLALVDGFWTDSPRIQNFKLTTEPNHSGFICMAGLACGAGRELLDYFMLDYDNWGGLHIAYVDDANGPVSVQYMHVPPSTAPVPDPDPETGDFLADFTAFVQGLRADVDATTSIGAVAYAWDWGDGATGDGVTASHEYAVPGSYTITLVVTSSAGGQAAHSTDITVGAGDNAAPKAAFGMTPQVPKPGQVVRFTDQSVDDGGVVLRAWDFGDGDLSSETNPSHTFPGVGTYTVRLQVTDSIGASDSVTKLVQVTASGTTNAPPGDETQGLAGPSAVMGLLGLLALALLRRRA